MIANVGTLVRKYKVSESAMAQYCNLKLSTSYGGSLLDASFLTEVATTPTTVLGVVSRRPLTPALLNSIYIRSDAVSYTKCAFTVTSVSGSLAYNGYNKQYNQQHRRVMSGYDLWTDFSAAAVFDGFVYAGTLASNIEGNSGPDFVDDSPNLPNRGPPLRAPGPQREKRELFRDIPPSIKGTVVRLAARLIPRKGKYCGPGWTAGVETAARDPAVVDGHYQVAPTDPEDAICKQHDEDYRDADGDLILTAAADKRMASRLDALNNREGLSLYGHAARIAIGAKGQLVVPTVDSY